VKRILVTGASGFCGRHLCRYLAARGYRVIGTYFHTPFKPLASVARQKLDISRLPEVCRLLQRLKPDAVIHLAAMSVPRLSWKREGETFGINTGGTLHLLEAIRQFSPQTKFLFASSVQVYGRTFRKGRAVSEKDLAWPESPYAASKLLAEYACLHYHDAFGLKVVIARAFNHLGRGQSSEFVFADWCRQIALAEKKRRRPVLETGNLDVIRDFLHVQDVVRAYELLLRKGESGGIYNIASGRGRLLENYVRGLLRRAKIPMKIEIQQKRLRRYDPPLMKGSAVPLRRLGWRPKYSAEAALRELLEEQREKV
jgi:GDP-4-dehydro-6-deoxy-D-mannose reductase